MLDARGAADECDCGQNPIFLMRSAMNTTKISSPGTKTSRISAYCGLQVTHPDRPSRKVDPQGDRDVNLVQV